MATGAEHCEVAGGSSVGFALYLVFLYSPNCRLVTLLAQGRGKKRPAGGGESAPKKAKASVSFLSPDGNPNFDVLKRDNVEDLVRICT